MNKIEADEINEKWLQGIKLNHNKDYEKEIRASYPESHEQTCDRINTLAEGVIENYS